MWQLRFKRFLGMGAGLLVLLAVLAGLVEVLSILGGGKRADRFSFQVLFKDVQGLRKGSRVVFRGMEVGTVGGMAPARGGLRVAVTVYMKKEDASLAGTTTRVWVVRPRLGFLSHQLSGLDTLVKESYLRILPGRGGRPLEEGETLLGLESPPPGLAEEELEDPLPGDLVGRVLFPRNHGLGPGSPVTFRGMPVGKVRRVTLVDRGKAVLVIFQVSRAKRQTVRRGSRFWITRPTLRGGVLEGFSLEDLDSVFFPSLAYDSPSPETSPPAPDGALFVGSPARPGRKESWNGKAVDPASAEAAARDLLPPKEALSPWVSVLYRAVDKDTITADDPIEGEGEGVLYRGRTGDYFVLTGRSASDGRWLMEGHWYDRLRIARERIQVTLSDGRIIDAERAWISKDRDLAVLRLKPAGGVVRGKLPPWKEYLSFEEREGTPGRKGHWKGPVLAKDEGRAWAVLGMARYRPGTPSTAPFRLVPARFRPAGGDGK